jgi:hypothetical protein
MRLTDRCSDPSIVAMNEIASVWQMCPLAAADQEIEPRQGVCCILARFGGFPDASQFPSLTCILLTRDSTNIPNFSMQILLQKIAREECNGCMSLKTINIRQTS